jgi:hypothetical protein
MSNLKIAACSHDAAKYAVENWHYSRILPTGKIVKFGVWEDGKFIGAVLFSRGASPHLGKALELDQTEICELTRVALTKHDAPVSQIVAEAMKLLKQSNQGLRAVISFADPKEGHRGGIYQAGNWIYTGQSNTVTEYFINGRWRHTRGAYHHPLRAAAPKREAPGKYRYVYPLDKQMRRKLTKLALNFPNAVEGLEVSRSDSVAEVLVQSQSTARKSK